MGLLDPGRFYDRRIEQDGRLGDAQHSQMPELGWLEGDFQKVQVQHTLTRHSRNETSRNAEQRFLCFLNMLVGDGAPSMNLETSKARESTVSTIEC